MPTSSNTISDDSRTDPLIAVVLCERIRDGAEIADRVAAVRGADVRVLVCRNRRAPTRFAAGVAVDVLRRPRHLAALASRRTRVSGRALHDDRVLRALRRWSPDVGLHAMGVIYRQPAIDAFRLGILNPHIGLLPEYRGRSVMEWSLLHGHATGITTFFIDEGIDTGERIVLREEVSLTGFRTVQAAKHHLFGLNAAMFERALHALTDPDFVPARQDAAAGRRWYVMSGLLTGVVERILADG
jgi:folate-dependent phosphoribosylglycinamide formyltransferase PurN